MLQRLCRSYLSLLRPLAEKFHLDGFVDGVMDANCRGECRATEDEVELLSRMVDDERIARVDIPKLLNRSYRACESDGTFDRIRKLRRVGIYSKVSALLMKGEMNGNKK